MTADRLAALQALTAHPFTDPALGIRALTHASWTNEHADDPHNEVLEFLGDSVVQLCLTVLLVEAFPGLREGALTTRRQALVSDASLARVGRERGLPPLIRLGSGEARKAEVEDTIVAGAVEALFGAILRDGGFDACLALARAWLAEAAMGVLARTRPEFADKPAKNQLQEWLQQRKLAAAVYTTLGSSGPAHDLVWTCRVAANGQVFTCDGRTKQAAQEKCARLALAALRHAESA
jgi:ribonuclease-3